MFFFKYQSLGNDFILFDASNHGNRTYFESHFGIPINQLLGSTEWRQKTKNFCNRQTGIGADGVLVAFSENHKLKALIFNSDGSHGNFSGNGARIAGRHFAKNDHKSQFSMGNILVRTLNIGRQTSIIVPMPTAIPRHTQLCGINGFFMDVGNPHFIIISENEEEKFRSKAPELGLGSPEFGGPVNVTNAWPSCSDYQTFEALTFERGVGFTKGCSSSALALFCILQKVGRATEKLLIKMPGGKVVLTHNKNDNCIWLTAGVSFVSHGEFK